MIPQIKRILYATDLSKNSVYAWRYAVDIAERRNAEIVIIHIIEPIPPSARHYMKIYVDELKWEEKLRHAEKMAVAEIEKRLRSFCEKESRGDPACVALVTKVIVRPGLPVDEILKAVEEERCDALVLGTHGKGFLTQTFLGSVARSVLDRSLKPVFIIPLPKGETDTPLEDI